ncbi:MAG: hypothetical protein ABF326_02855 [Arenicellales bacterium]
MKTSMKTAAAVALSLTASQALAFDTEIQQVGMLYLNIPLNTQSVPEMDKSVMGLRFGQTRISTDRAGSLFTYFRTRPALFDIQFGMVRDLHSADDLRFGLLDLKLTGISSVEKTYINGAAVVGGIVATKVLAGAAAVGGIAAAAAASGGDKSDDDASGNSSSSKNDDRDDDVAEHENEHEQEHENEAQNEHENEHEEEHENEHENEAENEHEDEHEVEGPEGLS